MDWIVGGGLICEAFFGSFSRVDISSSEKCGGCSAHRALPTVMLFYGAMRSILRSYIDLSRNLVEYPAVMRR